MSPVDGAQALGGITVAGYAKAGVSGGGVLGSVSAGLKVGGGKDLVTGQNVGGKSTEVSVSPKAEKLGVSGGAQGGLEVSAYVRPGDVAAKIGEKIMEVAKPLIDSLNNSRFMPHPK